ncbi:hypothetical protein [Neobacillus kokaensis]|uniref:Uncharacterized protein n=1 Tax=Neobacillus kokaensis TaxID=2759023 RepID=A0ABQ3NCI4_9BACI|nr:hypothetical protein [Neobacillus kokaensis]GHI01620.1 hypothetical protein AM1BK_51620 [Neobacillus kokaensis]
MDIKEQKLLNYYYEKLSGGTFDEKDVYAFFHLIRNQCDENSCIQELIDFVMLRDRYEGRIKEAIFASQKKFEQIGKTKAAIRINDVFSFKEIKSALNKALENCQLAALENDKINDFITCLISILQQVQIMKQEDGSSISKEIGKLFFAVSQKQIILMAEIEVSQNLFKKTNVVFPVLTVNNNYVDLKKQDRYDTPYLFADQVVEIKNHDGKLEIAIPN